jgi:hypothetical protein
MDEEGYLSFDFPCRGRCNTGSTPLVSIEITE